MKCLKTVGTHLGIHLHFLNSLNTNAMNEINKLLSIFDFFYKPMDVMEPLCKSGVIDEMKYFNAT